MSVSHGVASRQAMNIATTPGYTTAFQVGAFIALGGKNYYVSPIYPIALAAGAVALEQGLGEVGKRWLGAVYAALVAISGVVLLPTVVPILSPERLIRYEELTHLSPPVVFEHHENGPLPQYFADEFGWEDMVREVARVYHALPPADQSRTTIFSNNWGNAAAIDFFGPRYGLPHAISNSDSYWDWGPRDCTGDIVIVLHSDGIGDRQHFETVEPAGRVENRYSRRDEWYEIFLCRGLRFDLRGKWKEMRVYD